VSRHLALVAQANERIPFNGATPEQVAAVSRLMAMSRFTAELCRAVMMDGSGPWDEVAASLEAGATLCRNMQVLEVELELQANRH